MNESDRRAQISAFMDGDTGGSDSNRVVEEMYRSPERRRTWSRYHLIGDAMRGTASVPGADTIAARVSAQLADERVVHVESRFRPRVWTPLRGLALAASVAAVAILGIAVLDDGGDLQTTSTTEPSNQMSTWEQTPRLVTGSRAQRVAGAAAQRTFAGPVYWARGDAAPDAEARINTYLINHSEHGGYGLGGVRYGFELDDGVAAGEMVSSHEWTVGWLPEGFRLTSELRRPIHRGRAPVVHRVYSDGLVSISVFIEQVPEAHHRFEGRYSAGAVNAFGRVVDGFQVSVVGEVPAITATKVAASVVKG